MDQQARIDALEAENERLRGDIDALRDAFGMAINPWVGLGLTPSEARLFGALVKRGQLSKQQIMTAMYSARAEDDPEIKIVDVFVCKVRKKLTPYGIEITTVWGQGYAMPPESRERARQFIDGAMKDQVA